MIIVGAENLQIQNGNDKEGMTILIGILKENQFRTVLIGGKYRISRKSFDAWLDGEMTEMEPEQHKDRMDLGGAEREEDQRESILNRYTSATR